MASVTEKSVGQPSDGGGGGRVLREIRSKVWRLVKTHKNKSRSIVTCHHVRYLFFTNWSSHSEWKNKDDKVKVHKERSYNESPISTLAILSLTSHPMIGVIWPRPQSRENHGSQQYPRRIMHGMLMTGKQSPRRGKKCMGRVIPPFHTSLLPPVLKRSCQSWTAFFFKDYCAW